MYYAGGEDKKSEEKKSEKEIVYATSREMKAYFQKMMEKMGEIAAKLEGALEENRKLRKDAERRDKEINNLQMKVELLEQRSRINNLEIVNLPVTPNENPVEIVKSLAQCVGVEIRDEDIQAVHRVPRYDKKGKNMVVQFCSRWKKNIILQACADFRKRNNNKITAKDINNSLPDQAVYVSEHLTPKNKILLRKTKQRIRDIGWKYSWTRDGAIYVRKDEQDRRRINITEESELQKLQ